MLISRYCQNHNLSPNINYAVSIPASFEANQRKDLMEALETNGMTLTKQSLIDEPNAAFISYVHESQTSENHWSLILITIQKCLFSTLAEVLVTFQFWKLERVCRVYIQKYCHFEVY